MYENMKYYATTYWNLKWHMFTHWPVTDVAKVGRGSMLSLRKNVWHKQKRIKKKRLFVFLGGVPLYLRPNMTKLFTITNIQLASGFRCFSNPYLIGFQKPPKKTTQPAAIVVPNAKLEELKLNKPHWDARYLSKDAEEVPKAPGFFVVKLKFGSCSYWSHMVFIWVVCRVGNVNWLKASNIYEQTKRVSHFFGSVRCKNENLDPSSPVITMKCSWNGRQKHGPWVQMLQKVTS